MDRPNVIQLGGKIKLTCNSDRALKPLYGRIVVEMDPPRESSGHIALPDDVQLRLRPDSGLVVASNINWEDSMQCLQCEHVLVRPYDGKWIDGFKENGYEPGQIRIYGVQTSLEHKPELVDWWRSILAVIEDECELKPTGKNVLIRRAPEMEQTPTGIILTANEAYREPWGWVVAVGPLVDEVEIDQRVVIQNDALVRFELEPEYWSYPHPPSEYALISEDGILAIIPDFRLVDKVPSGVDSEQENP